MLRNIILRALFSRKHGVVVSITNALLLRALAPCLGVSRHLPDYSPSKSPAFITGAAGFLSAAWVSSDGQWAYSPSGTGNPALEIGGDMAGRTTAIGGARLWSCSLWTKPNAIVDSEVLYRESVVSSFSTPRVGILMDGTGAVDVSVRNTDGGATQTWLTNGLLTTTKWHHIAVNINKFTGAMQVFLNGVEQTFSASGTLTIADWDTGESNSANGVTFGGTGAGTRFSGYLDDLMVFHRNLSYEDVRLLSRYRGIAYTPRRFRRAHYDGATIPPAPTIRFFPRRIFNRVLP